MQTLLTLKSLAVLLLMSTSLAIPMAFGDNSLESQWLYSLKHAHLDNGSSLPINEARGADTLRISSRDIGRLFTHNDPQASSHYSNLQFSPLNYQAEINEKQVSVRLFYQF